MRFTIRPGIFVLAVLMAAAVFGCGTAGPRAIIEPPTYTGPARAFQAPFTDVSEFSGFYIVPQNANGSSHELSTERFVDAPSSHKAWITSANDDDNDSHNGYRPHRAYPTVNFQRTPEGIYRTPCLATLYVWLDMTLLDRAPSIDDWMSFVTLTPDASDFWTRTVLVNIEHNGYLRLMHVPHQGEQAYVYHDTSVTFPQGQWVRLDVYIDFSSTAGCAVVWQDKVRVCEALVNGGVGGLAQAHFGLYASAAVGIGGQVYNDKLRIVEVADRAAAEILVLDDW